MEVTLVTKMFPICHSLRRCVNVVTLGVSLENTTAEPCYEVWRFRCWQDAAYLFSNKGWKLTAVQTRSLCWGNYSFFLCRKKDPTATRILPEGRLACGQYITWTYRMGSITHGKKSLWWILPEKGETLHQQWLGRYRVYQHANWTKTKHIHHMCLPSENQHIWST